VDEETHYYVCPIPSFQIIIDTGGMVKFHVQCENLKIQIGKYHDAGASQATSKCGDERQLERTSAHFFEMF